MTRFGYFGHPDYNAFELLIDDIRCNRIDRICELFEKFPSLSLLLVDVNKLPELAYGVCYRHKESSLWKMLIKGYGLRHIISELNREALFELEQEFA